MRRGQPIRAFYGSTVLFDFSDWDISKTREFGYHFGLEDESQSLHRIALTGGYLYEVRLTFSKPLMMRDALRWDLRAISDALGVDPTPHIADASRLARNNFSSPRVEGNLIAAQLLDAAGYDAIIYENMGESGGTAAVIWHSEQIEVIDVKKVQGSGNMRITERQLRQIIRETLLNEIDIEEVGESCWAAGSTHELSTCSIGGDQFYLKFSDERRFDSDDPSLQILNEYLSYQIYKLYPDASTPSRIELVYDKTRGRVGLASAAVERGNKMMSSRQLAALLSAGVYVDIFLANWDISNTANVIISPEGDKATRIDLGGNLDFRAQGKRKGKMFGDDPGELSTMLPTSPKKITDIFTGSDLRVAADTFLGVPWPAIAATVQQTHENVLNDLTERGMETLAGQWNSYVAHVTPILAKRHRSVALHAQHILDTGGGVTEARLRRFINETLAEDEEEDDDSYFSDFPGRPDWMPDIPSDVMTTVSSKPIPVIRDTSRQCGYGRKPRGLWYAPGTAWIDWMQYEMPDWLAAVTHVYTLQPNYAQGGLDSRGGVLQLQSVKDLLQFTRRFAVEQGKEINWPEVVEIWDGIEIIPAQFDMAGDPSTFWYWGWDIPSGCIWRPEGAANFRLLASKRV